MKKSITFCFLLVAATLLNPVQAKENEQQIKPVKNIILMISDGTSLASVSLARWLQWYEHPDRPKLFLDPYLCGTVRTFSSNAPIGDSAPTTSCYMTGYPSRTGYVATYPLSDPRNDIFPTDPKRAYQPMATLLEAGKMSMGKSSGLVFTCEFPHATPADCSAHSYKRGKYAWIAPQMVHNDLDVVIGGGAGLLNAEEEAYLKNRGYSLYKDDLPGMRADKNKRMWALYAERDMDYDLDRDTTQQPSLAEMTRTALSKLSQNPEGFFLMVEGSKVDWAAHANDPVGIAREFQAFDRACGAALDFARKNGETAVIITADHGNSGISIGVARCTGYDKLSKDQLFYQLSQFKLTAAGFAKMLNSRPASEVQDIFRQYAGFELTAEELKALYNCKGYKNSPIPMAERSDAGVEKSLYSSGELSDFMTKLITSKTCIGFTTHGHTGEDVFLSVYNPNGQRPTGMNDNVELNAYMCALFGINRDSLDLLTKTHFARHADVFKDYKYEILPAAGKGGFPSLLVKGKKKQLLIRPYTNLVELKSGKKQPDTIHLNSVVVYVDANNTFYLPTGLAGLLD
ncbi:MAG: alkaline phosphatase [Tannerella sp.]|jgi:alkaline phosphatase|nr:alkaline phosphatase [Tannerella sp.]